MTSQFSVYVKFQFAEHTHTHTDGAWPMPERTYETNKPVTICWSHALVVVLVVWSAVYDVTRAKCENNSVAARAIQASPGNKIISDTSSSGIDSSIGSGDSHSRRCFIYFLTFTICISFGALYTFVLSRTYLYML